MVPVVILGAPLRNDPYEKNGTKPTKILPTILPTSCHVFFSVNNFCYRKFCTLYRYLANKTLQGRLLSRKIFIFKKKVLPKILSYEEFLLKVPSTLETGQHVVYLPSSKLSIRFRAVLILDSVFWGYHISGGGGLTLL